MEGRRRIVGELRHGILNVADALAQSVALLSLALGGGFAVGISFVLVIGSFFMSVAMTAHTGIHWGWYPWFFVFLGALALLAFLDIRISTRLQLVAAAVGVGAILVLAIVIAAKGGDGGLSIQPLNPAKAHSTSDLFLAVVLTFTGFIGFEAAAVLVALVYYVFVTWAMAIGYGIGGAGKWASDPAALDTLAKRYVGNWLAVIIDFSVAASGVIAALGGLHLTSRTLYAMGREGGLPRMFAWTHPRFRTPWIGIAFSLLVTLLLGVFFAHRYNPPITYFIWMATCATIGILITYILIAFSGIVFFARARSHGWNPLLDLVLPAGAIAICGY